MIAFAPITRIVDWFTTDQQWRELRKHAPGQLGLAALAVVKEEAAARAREIGANNSGPFIIKYGGKEGRSWCARLIHWSITKASVILHRSEVLVRETGGARALFMSAVRVGWRVAPGDERPGDLVLFSRGTSGRKKERWKAHIGILDDDIGYYWAGNEGKFPARVRRHKLTAQKRKRLIGFARLP